MQTWMEHGYSCSLPMSVVCSSYCHGAKLNQKHVVTTLFGPNMSMLEKQMGHMLVLQLSSTWLPSNVPRSPLVSHKVHAEGWIQRQVLSTLAHVQLCPPLPPVSGLNRAKTMGKACCCFPRVCSICPMPMGSQNLVLFLFLLFRRTDRPVPP